MIEVMTPSELAHVESPNVVTFERGKPFDLSTVRTTAAVGRQGGRQLFRLDTQIYVILGRSPHYPTPVQVVIPAGLVTDLASVPRAFHWYAPPQHPDYRVAAIVHDYLYRFGVVSRGLADQIFRDLITKRRPVRRWLMWAAVRAGGRRSYRNPSNVAGQP